MMHKGMQESSNEYERIRIARIQQNKTRLQESGIQNIANSLKSLVDSSKNKKKTKEKLNMSNERDTEYFPNSSDGEDDPPNLDFTRKTRQSSSRHRVQFIPPQSMKKYPTFAKQGVTLNSSDRLDKSKQGSFDNEIAIGVDQTLEKQDTEEVSSSRKKIGNKVTMADLILQKKQSSQFSIPKQVGTRLQKQNLFVEPDLTGEDISPTSEANENRSNLHRSSHLDDLSGVGKEVDIQSDYEGEGDTEDEDILDHSSGDDSEDENEQINLDRRDLEQQANLEAKTRGPTMLHHVHMRPLEQRKPIILNEFGQPIGPVIEGKNTVVEFSRFLGTLARDHSFAPIVFNSWRKVPNKDRMWEYVLRKYIVPDEGKEWVMKTIGSAWKIYKCRFKKKHYYQYNNDKSRWQNRSKRVPDEDFIKLLGIWKKKDEKIRCSQNRDRRLSQKNMHTAGPKSFATIREEMKNEHPEKESPSLAELFERTRKRSEGKKYKDSYEDTGKKIEEMKNYVPPIDGSGPTDAFLGVMGKESDGRCRLYGRGVSNKKLKVNSQAMTYVVPTEILESLRVGLFEGMRKDMESEIARVQDMRREIDEEHLRKKAELEKIQKDLDHQKETMIEQVMQNVLSKIPAEIARQYLSS